MQSKRYPLSDLLPEPAMSELWLERMSANELRQLRLVSGIWNEFVLKLPAWGKFPLHMKPALRINYPELNWMNPLDWSLLDELHRHAKTIAHIELDSDSHLTVRLTDPANRDRSISVGRFHRAQFLEFAGVENPAACYGRFNNDHLMGPFIRKFLFYNFELSYLFIFCTTLAVAMDSNENSSLLGAILRFFWMLIIFLHFALFHVGTYLVLKYCVMTADELTLSIPCFGVVVMPPKFVLVVFLTNLTASILLAYSSFDVILLGIWIVCFNSLRLSLAGVADLTSQLCPGFFTGTFATLLVICLVKINCLFPILSTCIFVAIWIVYYLAYYAAKGIFLKLDFTAGDLLLIAGLCFIALVGQFLWSSHGFLVLIVADMLQSGLLLITIRSFQMGIFLDYLRDHLKAIDDWRFLDLSWLFRFDFKTRFFQFYFCYYLVRLVVFFYERIAK